ncbi:hypothetical protein K438DRAFT_1982720 [Mycena galopus ATCC 62051]|nr:hypothetical protein K438DRAFT_1982720 [Mycena galopus ATCC 62051]
MDPLKVQARVLRPSMLNYGAGFRQLPITPGDGACNIVEKKFFKAVANERWVIVIYEQQRRFNDQSAQDVINRLCGRCRDVGINLAPVPQDHRPTAPKRIIFYRDVISGGQYKQVLEQEIPILSCISPDAPLMFSRFSAEACVSLGISPTVAILVVGKRHHVQFFPTSERDVDCSRNCKTGTLSSVTSLIPPRFLPSSARRVAGAFLDGSSVLKPWTMWTGNTEEPVAIRLRTGRAFAPLCFLPSESIDDWMTYYHLYYIAVNIHNYIAMELNA